ncbi:eukaryotic rRNA processing protein EBP2-domain-containing protein [Kalaharituber pfeilii]|nr:eukaryotic rRNA processing protein EBP2-domain-containing protein [Kalaharituber pfeilii]
MVKSKLKFALDRYQERDYAKERQKKLRKKAEKEKRAKGLLPGVNGEKSNGTANEERDEEDEEEEEEEEEVPELVYAETTVEDLKKDGKEGKEKEKKEHKKKEKVNGVSKKVEMNKDDKEKDEEDEEENDEDEENGDEEGEEDEEDEDDEVDEEEEESDIDLSEIENEDDLAVSDVIPHQRLTINNKAALMSIHARIALPTSSIPFSEHLSVTSSASTEIKDIHDDLNRELAFYMQALAAANTARSLLYKEGVPFSRPSDYFAEMVKTDEHMAKIKQKLLEEAANKKAAQEARKQRDLRKFGKQVQVAKLQEREKQKKQTLEKIQALKRKRASGEDPLTTTEDPFDISLEEPAPSASKKRRTDTKSKAPNTKRQKKDAKFGYGGKKRHAKSNDAMSSADITGFSVKANKAKGFSGGGKKKRPGKSVRKARRS